jgi:MFS family permease
MSICDSVYKAKKFLIIQYLGFFKIGITGNIVGPTLPMMKMHLGVEFSREGLILSGQFLRMFFTMLVGGYLADRILHFPEDSGKITSLLLAFAAGGGFLLASAFGKVADIAGIGMLPIVILLLSCLLTCFSTLDWGVFEKKVQNRFLNTNSP